MNFFKDLDEGVRDVFRGPSEKDNLFTLNHRVPFNKAIPFGLQHVLAMFAGNLAPIIIVFSALGLLNTSFAVNALLGALFMAGLGTIGQLLLGARLPIVIGTSFTFVPIFITIGLGAGGGEAAFYTIMGSVMVGGAFATLFSLLYRWWGKIIKPIVPAIVILGVGFSLLASGATSFLGGNDIIVSVMETGKTPSGVPYFCYIIVAFVTLITALLWSLFIKGVWKNVNIVVGIIVGFIVSCCIPGMVDFSALAIDTSDLIGPHGIFDYPHLIDLTKIRIELVPCLLTSVCYIVALIEAIGNTTALAETGLGRDPSRREIVGALAFDGFNSALGAFFGALPLTTYSENVGIVAQNKVVNRFTLFVGACFLILASFFPPIANFIYAIPDAVIGGTMVILFGSIAVIGMKSISDIGWTDKNIMIVSISVCLGLGLTIAHVTLNNGEINLITDLFRYLDTKHDVRWISDLLSNSMLNMFILSLILSWVLPDSMHISLFHKKEK